MTFDINLLAVLVAAIAGLLLGGLWYSPFFLGKQWMREAGLTKESIKSMKMTPVKSMSLGFVGTLITSYVLAHFVAVWAAVNGSMMTGDALQLGFWIWLGFAMPITLGVVLWEDKSWKLFAINTSYYLVMLPLMGAILAWWM